METKNIMHEEKECMKFKSYYVVWKQRILIIFK